MKDVKQASMDYAQDVVEEYEQIFAENDFTPNDLRHKAECAFQSGYYFAGEALRWIPVSERKPPQPGIKVLALVNPDVIDLAYWEEPSIWFPNGNFWGVRSSNMDVTHWMPLPKSPERKA